MTAATQHAVVLGIEGIHVSWTSEGLWGRGGVGECLYLMWQVQFLTPVDGDGSTEHTTCVFQHEVDLLGSDLLCCYYQVTLVLTVFIVYYDDKLSFSEVIYGFFNCI